LVCLENSEFKLLYLFGDNELFFIEKCHMRRKINFSFLILLIMLSSCSTDLELDNYIDMSAPFTLTINTTNSETGLTESKSTTLEVNSEKWKNLVDWGNNIKDGWTPSPASHIGDVYVVQSDFGLIHTKNSKGVVITFTDKEGNPKQYVNVIEKGELSFLYE